ncbi:hypothetical protein TGAMA5MH_04846 [Trichoderma gamsii]|uniref:Transcription factor TFIIIC triple barrel domain-containing protein n=1 Tax=Trichoderma gamsii TaxID=398673 RepID=A0A2K0TCZ3_9HYPO|nr:hypothetical protein TGAMA5MH_04846 [Trichoderma gamsii]
MATAASTSELLAAKSKISPWLDEEPGALHVDKVLEQVSQDDQDEWEYEYSTTETEVYYLTLDLSYPEFKERPAKAHHHSRGGYYKNWSDQYADNNNADVKHDKQVVGPHDSGHNEINNVEDDGQGNGGAPEPEEEIQEEDAPGEEEENEEDANIDPRLRAISNPTKVAKPVQKDKGKGKEREDAAMKEAVEPIADDNDSNEPLEEIQILELHSRNPIISYRGRVFEGQWAEVIGTEAILADREAKNATQLPALRHLPGGVDILGASSSRILTTEKTLKPKGVQKDSLKAIREEWNIRIPPGKDRTGERAQQLRFLENLIALKKKRGDEDEVTVYAVDGAGKDFDDRKGPDFKPRRKKPSLGVEQSNGASQSDRGERRYTRRSQGRQGGRRRRASAIRSTSAATDRGVIPAPDSTTLSTPTPGHWDELLGIQGDEEDNNNDSLSDIDEDSDAPARMRAGFDEEDEDDDEDEDDEEDEDDGDVIMLG